MRGKLHVIEPSGAIRLVREFVDEQVDLGALQKIVGGYIELVPGFGTIELAPVRGAERCLVFCNEDGKRPDLRMSRNDAATALWERAIGGKHPRGDYLVGPIAVLTGDASFLDV